MMGGGDTHRFRLDDTVLIKDNHIKIVGSVGRAVKMAAVSAMKSTPQKTTISASV